LRALGVRLALLNSFKSKIYCQALLYNFGKGVRKAGGAGLELRFKRIQEKTVG
jgi:hypothetical protein